MADGLLHRLRTFGAYIMFDDGTTTPFQPNPLTTAAADEIERLTAALHLAAGLLSTLPPYDHMTPDRVLEFLTKETDLDRPTR